MTLYYMNLGLKLYELTTAPGCSGVLHRAILTYRQRCILPQFVWASAHAKLFWCVLALLGFPICKR